MYLYLSSRSRASGRITRKSIDPRVHFSHLAPTRLSQWQNLSLQSIFEKGKAECLGRYRAPFHHIQSQLEGSLLLHEFVANSKRKSGLMYGEKKREQILLSSAKSADWKMIPESSKISPFQLPSVFISLHKNSMVTIFLFSSPISQKLDSTEREKETEVLPDSSAHRRLVDDRLRLEFDHLDKFVEYSFRIVAHNQNGPGTSTPKVVARTHSDSK